MVSKNVILVPRGPNVCMSSLEKEYSIFSLLKVAYLDPLHCIRSTLNFQILTCFYFALAFSLSFMIHATH